MNYGEVLKESAHIFWHHKLLWVMGLLTALFGYNDYQISLNFQADFGYPNTSQTSPELPPWVMRLMNDPASFLQNLTIIIITVFIIYLGWWLVSFILGWIVQGGLVGMVDQIDQTQSSSLQYGWQIGSQHVASLCLIAFLLALPNLIILIPFMIWLISIVSAVIAADTSGNPEAMLEIVLPLILSGLACLIPMICFGILLAFVLDLLRIMAIRSCVLEDLGPIASLKRGWQIAWQNIGYTLLTWFIILALRTTISTILTIPALILMIPVSQTILIGDWSTLTMGLLSVLIGYFLLMNVGLGGLLTTFNVTLWTKLYKAYLNKENEFAH